MTKTKKDRTERFDKLDVLDMIFRALKQAKRDVTMDNDAKSGSILLVTEDGKEWLISSENIRQQETETCDG